jgi:hypothetical protein
MKKSLFILSFLVCASTCFAQGPFPIKQGIGNPNTLLKVNGASKDSLASILATWADTSSANINPYIRFYPGAMIRTLSPANTTWIRNDNATAWIQFSTGPIISSLFARTDVRNNTGADMYFSAADRRFYIDSVQEGSGIKFYESATETHFIGFNSAEPMLQTVTLTDVAEISARNGEALVDAYHPSVLGYSSHIAVRKDGIFYTPWEGRMNIDTLQGRSDSAGLDLMARDRVTGDWVGIPSNIVGGFPVADTVGARFTYAWSTNPLAPSWSDATPNTTITTNGVSTNFSGGAFSTGNVISQPFYVGVENFTLSQTVVTNVKSGTSQGLGLRLTGSAGLTQDMFCHFLLADTTGYLALTTGNIVPTWSNSNNRNELLFLWDAGDTLDLLVEKRFRQVTIKMTNRANGMESKLVVKNQYPSVGTLAWVFYGGDFNFLGDFVVYYNEVFRPTFAAMGNSIQWGDQVTEESKYISQVAYDMGGGYVNMNSPYEQSINGTYRVQDVITYVKPENLIIAYGVNDLNNAINLDSFSRRIQRIVVPCLDSSVNPILVNLVPQIANAAPYNDTLQAIATRYGLRYIDIYTALKDPSGIDMNIIYQADIIHPNQLGHNVIASVLRNGIKDLFVTRPPISASPLPIDGYQTFHLAVNEQGNFVRVFADSANSFIRNNPVTAQFSDLQTPGNFNIGGEGVMDKLYVTGTSTYGNPNFSVNANDDGFSRAGNFATANLRTSGGQIFFDGAIAPRVFFLSGAQIFSHQQSMLIERSFPSSGTHFTLILDNDNSSVVPGDYKILQAKRTGTEVAYIDRGGGMWLDSTLRLGTAGTRLGLLQFNGNTSGTVSMRSAAAAGTWALTLPTTDGTPGQFLQTDGDGITTWATASGSGTDNTNAGAGFRLVLPATQEIKTIFAGTGIVIDSTTNANGLTIAATGSGSAVDMNDILAATATNSIDNLNFKQNWNWTTLAGDTALAINSTNTTAASDAQVGFAALLKGANANSGQLTAAIVGVNTHTGTTSENIGVRGMASGASAANYAGFFDNIVSVGGASIVGGASASHVLIVRSLDNTAANGIALYPNANYGTVTNIGYGGMTASADFFISVVGGDYQINSAQTYFGGAVDPTAKIHIAAGATGAGTAPIKFTSGTFNTTGETGAIEYNGTNLTFVRTGTARESIITASAVNAVSPTAPNRTITVVIDGVTYYLAAKTTND